MKKSQIKMMESIIVIVIFFMLLVFGMFFYVKVKIFSTKQQAEESRELGAIGVVEMLTNMPEFQCSAWGVANVDCFDIYKIQAFMEMYENENTQDYYYDFFPNTEIVFTQVFPSSEPWIIFDYVPSGRYNKKAAHFPIVLDNVYTEQKNFGYLTIGVYIEG